MNPLKQPCQACRDHKPNAPFKIRDDNGIFIQNEPYQPLPLLRQIFVGKLQTGGGS